MNKNKLIILDRYYIKDMSNNVFRVIVDGKNISTVEKFLTELENMFMFPRSCEGNLNRFLDWMRDLSWIENEEIELIVINQEEWMSSDLKIRNIIINLFVSCILPFWDEEVIYTVVGGKKKIFNVYLTNNLL